MTLQQAIEKLNRTEKAIYALNHATCIVSTDGETAAPRESWRARGESLAYLSELLYQQTQNPELEEALQTILAHREETDEITYRRAQVLQEDYEDMHVLPMEEYVAYGQLTNDAGAVWRQAKQESDYALFAPYLEKLIAARRRYASLKAPEKPVYDVLLDCYEKGATMAQLDPFFETVRRELTPLIAEFAKKPLTPPAFMSEVFPVAAQREFSDRIMALEGIDPARCTLGETEHPFTSGPNKWDVRITTHYHKEDVLASLYSVIHEGGHALYEMGVADELQYTCLGGGSTMGVHESQSRFYENLIGRSRAFAEPLLRAMKEFFPDQMRDVTEEELYRAVNLAKPSLIRTEADELTYSLHVMIRYELEKAMMAGDLTVPELPAAWNEMYRKYLGVTPPDDRQGVLQDSHWSFGGMGYFPSYALGSAYGVQMLRRMEKEMDVWGNVARGDLSPITAWLGEKIHRFGRLKEPMNVLQNAMGGPLDPTVYTDYLKEKFTPLLRA
ncbi:MAG: carboxypeptidase M32 [Clostridia bacterium]|nr:carboxypeptidase M32 [Clostridia bacterium]